MKLRDALLLGRVSNLPTVWTNVLAGAVLSGAVIESGKLFLVLLALTSFYVGGMYLNDAFDRDVDARTRPERPIPSGRVSAGTVLMLGFAMLIAGVALLGTAGGAPAFFGGLGLAALIVLYDLDHKGNRLSPLIMGLCRGAVYVCSALAFRRPAEGIVLIGAVLLAGWVVGLSHVAKHERSERFARWPLLFLGAPLAYATVRLFDEPAVLLPALLLSGWTAHSLSVSWSDRAGAVVRLIAGIAILDAVLIASRGERGLALIALVSFVLTRILQRYVPAT